MSDTHKMLPTVAVVVSVSPAAIREASRFGAAEKEA
jgi:hypothetical protein